MVFTMILKVLHSIFPKPFHSTSGWTLSRRYFPPFHLLLCLPPRLGRGSRIIASTCYLPRRLEWSSFQHKVMPHNTFDSLKPDRFFLLIQDSAVEKNGFLSAVISTNGRNLFRVRAPRFLTLFEMTQSALGFWHFLKHAVAFELLQARKAQPIAESGLIIIRLFSYPRSNFLFCVNTKLKFPLQFCNSDSVGSVSPVSFIKIY